MAPCGIYPAAGEDCWISIAVADDEEWVSLVHVAGADTGLDDIRFTTVAGREASQDELDKLITNWTAQQGADGLAERLAQVDVAAFPVRDIAGLYFCPHHQERNVFPTTEHPHVGYEPLPGISWNLHATPGSIRRPAPDIGEHTAEILDSLGYPAAEIEALATAGDVHVPGT